MNATISLASLRTDHYQITLLPNDGAMMRYSATGAEITLSGPTVEIDGKCQRLRPDRLDRAGEPRAIGNGTVEHLPDGRATITAKFTGLESAKMIVFGSARDRWWHDRSEVSAGAAVAGDGKVSLFWSRGH